MRIRRATGGVSAVGKPGTANQFQRRELVAVPVLRRTHESGIFERVSEVGPGDPSKARSIDEEDGEGGERWRWASRKTLGEARQRSLWIGDEVRHPGVHGAGCGGRPGTAFA